MVKRTEVCRTKNIQCPHCKSLVTRVLDGAGNGLEYVRRRNCAACGKNFFTVETAVLEVDENDARQALAEYKSPLWRERLEERKRMRERWKERNAWKKS